MRNRWFCSIMAVATVLVVPALRSQPAEAAGGLAPAGPVTATEAGDKGDFPVIEEIKRRQKELEREKFEQRRKKQLDDIRLLVKRASQQDSDDDKVRGYLQAQELLQRLWQEKPEPLVKREMDLIEKRTRDVPAPRQFTEATGLTMVLVESGNSVFYITPTPVSEREFGRWVKLTGGTVADELPDTPQTSVTWNKAADFCRWVTEQNRHPFRLPSVEELRTLKRRPPVAVWTETVWQGPDITARRMRERFGVTMYSVLDPAQRLANGEVFGELPFAAYPEIGFAVATDVERGMQHRLNRLKGKAEK